MKTNETFQYIAQYRKLSYSNIHHNVIEYSHNIDDGDDSNKGSKKRYDCDDNESSSTPLPSSSSSQLLSSSSSSHGDLAQSRTDYWLTCVYAVKNW